MCFCGVGSKQAGQEQRSIMQALHNQTKKYLLGPETFSLAKVRFLGNVEHQSSWSNFIIWRK